MLFLYRVWLIAVAVAVGNFGSMDGDPAAAMRYTEAKLMPFAYDALISHNELDENVVNYTANFDGSEKVAGLLVNRFL
jgi:DNA gyrase/topoisomerase IV subunit A